MWRRGWFRVQPRAHSFNGGTSTEDFSESNNLAESEPERLHEMIDLWWLEAGRYGVLPLDDRALVRGGLSPHPGAYHENPVYRFCHPVSHVPTSHAPQVRRGDWVLTVDIDVPDPNTEGVLYAQGSIDILHVEFKP